MSSAKKVSTYTLKRAANFFWQHKVIKERK